MLGICPRCNGSKKELIVQVSFDPTFLEAPCRECHGRGILDLDDLPNVSGENSPCKLAGLTRIFGKRFIIPRGD